MDKIKIEDMEHVYYPEDPESIVNGRKINLPTTDLPIDVIMEVYRELHDEAFGYDGDTNGFQVSVSPEFSIPSGTVIRQVVMEDKQGIIIYTIIKREMYFDPNYIFVDGEFRKVTPS